MAETLHWSIDGEFITNLARTRFWDEDIPYEKCEELLLSCLITDQLSQSELKDIARDIIEGRSKLTGINIFALENDNENVRPLSIKLEEQRRKLGIADLKNKMSCRMIDFVDPYSTVKSLKAAKEYNVTTYNQCTTWFWYNDTGIQKEYMRPWRPGEDMLLEENDETALGLWLYDYPDIAYDALEKNGNSLCYGDFWASVYDIIKDDPRFQTTKFDERNENYKACLRMKKDKPFDDEIDETLYIKTKIKMSEKQKATIDFTNKWLSEHPKVNKDGPADKFIQYHTIHLINEILLKDDCFYNDNEMYLIIPDNYDKWEGLIAPNGDFYSCDFGGHNAKAYHLICSYPEKFPNLDYETIDCSCSDALDTLLEQGWCATRYLPTLGNYIDLPKTKSGECTKAQKNAIFDAKIKHEIRVDLSPIGY